MMSELFKITDAHTDWHKRFHYEISKKVSLYVDTTDVSNAVKTKVLKPEVVLPVVGHLTFDPTQGQSVGAFMGRNVYLFRNNQDLEVSLWECCTRQHVVVIQGGNADLFRKHNQDFSERG